MYNIEHKIPIPTGKNKVMWHNMSIFHSLQQQLLVKKYFPKSSKYHQTKDDLLLF